MVRTKTLSAIGFAILLNALSPTVAFTTTIVGIRTPDVVVIASDSAGTFRGMDSSTERPVCKIFVVKEAVFAVGGLVKDPTRGFDVEQLVAEGLWTRSSISTAAQEIRTSVSSQLREELIYLSAHNPSLFARTLSEDQGYATSVLIAGIENGEPTAIGFGIRASGDTADTLSLSASTLSCPGDCPAGVYTFLPGRHAAIDRYRRHYGGQVAMSPELAAPFFANLEIEANTPSIAPPIDVVRLDRAGISWPARKLECGNHPSGFKPIFNR
jgi:hypothetical protein